MLASLKASTVPEDTSREVLSMWRMPFGPKYTFASKSEISPACLLLNLLTSNRVTGFIPDTPSVKFFQKLSLSAPRGEITETPVITILVFSITNLLLSWELFYNQAAIVTAKCMGIVQSNIYRLFSHNIRYIIQITFRIRRLIIYCRRNGIVLDNQCASNCLNCTGRTHCMPNHGFYCTNCKVHGFIPKHLF